MSQEKIKPIIEAILMVSDQPVNISKLLAIFTAEQSIQTDRDTIKQALDSLKNDYHNHGIELVEVASGFRFQANAEYATWVNHLFDQRPPRYSRALLETLAIIAYRQPITRSEIESIRGVSISSTIIKTLQEREWIKIVGYRDVPGKPALLASTKTFLDYFNLKKLSDLPALEDIKDFDTVNPDLFAQLEEEKKDDTPTDLKPDINNNPEIEADTTNEITGEQNKQEHLDDKQVQAEQKEDWQNTLPSNDKPN